MALAIAAVSVARGVFASGSGPGTATGCGDVPELVDLAEPDLVQAQRGPGLDGIPAILDLGGRLVDVATIPADIPIQLPSMAPEGRAAQAALLMDHDLNGDGSPEWIVEVFYGSRPPAEGEIHEAYLDADGLYFRQQRSIGLDAEELLAQLKDQGRRPLPPVVAVGPYQAVAIHADPLLRNDLRPWHLYWSDGVSDFTIQGDVDVAELVRMARSLYCSG
ncbi:MAG: hypothetical protein ACR2K4_05255 [Candidatus Limnocylindria bacterium]